MSLKSWFGRLNAAERIIFFSAVGLSLFILWASLAQVDEVTRGQGRVIPSSKVQLVQAAAHPRMDVAQPDTRPSQAHLQQQRHETAHPQRVRHQGSATVHQQVRGRRNQQTSQLFGR